MISEEKVKIMTSLAQYEKKEGTGDLRINRYSCGDYVRMETMKVGVALVVALLLLTGIIVIFRMEDVISMMRKGTIAVPAILILICFEILFFCYVKSTRRRAEKRYNEAMVRIKAYERQLEKLLEVYEEEEKEDNSPKIDMDAEELADGKIIDL
ncbi:MAG: hypothetical protein ACLUMF_09165 [Anaerostipes caccae]|uniref:hypothetical protein n=1 Tax=Anaerostipes caccae TaxID=105841 RepID=UPI0039919274